MKLFQIKKNLIYSTGLLVLILPTLPATALTWKIAPVDTQGSVGFFSSLALDSSDLPHISYQDISHRILKYAWWDGTTWQQTTVDPNDGGWATSLALDSNDQPHISYYGSSMLPGGVAYGVKHAWLEGTTWHHELVETPTSGTGPHTSLAVDSANRPHISYHDYPDLKYAWWDDAVSAWQIETVDTGGCGDSLSLALDSRDRPHISYRDYTNFEMKYARWDDVASAWQIETVGRYGEFTSLALDSGDHPHISYRSSSLGYSWWDDVSSTWQHEIVDTGGSDGFFASLALDSHDQPHISYMNYYELDIKYAWWDDAASTWQLEIIETVPGVNDGTIPMTVYTSLDLDSTENPHISYCYWTSTGESWGDGDLKYAHGEEPFTSNGISLFSDVIFVLPTTVFAGALVVLHRRRRQ